MSGSTKLPQADHTSTQASTKARPRGFAAISPELRREISRKGGIAAHASGTAHEFSPEEARTAGRLGGKAVHAKNRRARGQVEDIEEDRPTTRNLENDNSATG